QSLGGKAPVGVARLAARHGVPTVVVCGRNTLTTAQLTAAGFDAVYALTDEEPDVARCIADPGPLLERIGRRIGERLTAARAS
ncbi:MAG TPA: glycerate kinase, partial [Friedmanniella sp.]